jgi:hypothetical protein
MNHEAYVRAFRLTILAGALIHARENQPEAVNWLEGRIKVAERQLAEVEE